MHTLFAYLIVAIVLIAMFFWFLPVVPAMIGSVVLLLVFGSQPLWAS